MTSALRWGMGGQHHAPAALPPGKTRYPLCRRLGRPQGRSGRVRKILSPPGFDPRTVQPVASRYTDCAILAPVREQGIEENVLKNGKNCIMMGFFISTLRVVLLGRSNQKGCHRKDMQQAYRRWEIHIEFCSEISMRKDKLANLTCIAE